MADFSKRHYEAIANILSGFKEETIHKHTLVVMFSAMLDRDNVRFDGKRFIDACERNDKAKLVLTNYALQSYIDQNGNKWLETNARQAVSNLCGECGQDVGWTITCLNSKTYCRYCLENTYEVEWK